MSELKDIKQILSGVGSTLALCCAMSISNAVSMAAYAQDNPIEVTGELVTVVGIADGDAKADADLKLKAEASAVLDNGVELGAVASIRADGQQPYQMNAGGRYSSLQSGGARGVGSEDADVFLEGAYLFARGGFGSLHLGRDTGVANRLAITSPSIFRSIGVNDWRTDLTGLNDVSTLNDFSGQATKVTYMPPPGMFGGAIGQLQLGVSYAPELTTCGVDNCDPEDGFNEAVDPTLIGSELNWRDVVETAVYYQKGIDVGTDPLTIGVSASFVKADEDDAIVPEAPILPIPGDYRSYAVGLNLAYKNLTLGGSLKTTNSGLNEDRDEDYLAFDAGMTYELGDWNFMLGYGAADAERDASLLLATPPIGEDAISRLDRETQTAQAGISYVFDHGVTLGAAAQFVDSKKADEIGGEEEAAAVMFESSIKF